MKRTDETFDLVRSLNKSEKRFFKLHSTVTDGRKNYLRVFDAMDKMREYDPQKLAAKLRPYQLNLSHEKKYLQVQILKAMRNFQVERKSYTKVNAMLSEIQFLFEKEHFVLCKKILDRAKTLAEKDQHTELLIALLMWEISLEGNLTDRSPEESNKERLRILEQVKRTQAFLQPTFDYELLNINMVEILRDSLRVRSVKGKKELEKIMGDPLLRRSTVKDLSANAQFFFHAIHFFHAVSSGNYSKGHPHVKATLNLLVKFPEACDITPRLFYNTTNNYMYSCVYAKKYNELKSFMKQYSAGQFKHLPIDLSMIEELMTQSILNYTLTGAIHSKEYSFGLKAISDYEKKFDAYEKMISEEHRIGIHYKIARLLFITGEHKKALQWLSLIINDSDQHYRPDTQCYARLLSILIHFERGDLNYLESAIVSAKRFLEKRKMLFKTEEAFLNFIKTSIKADGRTENRKLMNEFRSVLMKFKGDPFERNAALHFDFEEWIEAKMK